MWLWSGCKLNVIFSPLFLSIRFYLYLAQSITVQTISGTGSLRIGANFLVCELFCCMVQSASPSFPTWIVVMSSTPCFLPVPSVPLPHCCPWRVPAQAFMGESHPHLQGRWNAAQGLPLLWRKHLWLWLQGSPGWHQCELDLGPQSNLFGWTSCLSISV